MPLSLRQLQAENLEWVQRNGLDRNAQPYLALLGVVEEVGEIAHAYLKAEEGIRGDRSTHEAKMRDAIGDTVVFLAQFCTRMGWDFEAVVEETWKTVKQRDWKANPSDGGQAGTENVLRKCEPIWPEGTWLPRGK